MAVDTTIDNAVIDFAAISNLLQTLKTHDDLFMKFASGSFGAYTPAGEQESRPMSASVFQMVGVRTKGSLVKGKVWSKEIPYGKAFAFTPTVTVTANAQTTDTLLITQIKGDPALDKCTVMVTDTKGTWAGDFYLNILALGPTASA